MRFNCQSDKSREPSTGQRTVPIKNVPINLKIKSAVRDGDFIRIVWDESSNQSDSLVSIKFLLNNSPSLNAIDFDKHYETLDNLCFFDYNEFISNGNKNENKIFEYI